MYYMPRSILTALGLALSAIFPISCAATPWSHTSQPPPEEGVLGTAQVATPPTTNSRNQEHTQTSSNNLTNNFRYYFSVTTDPYEQRMGRNWSDQLTFNTDILSRDYVIFYQHLIGNYPKPGPHLAMDDAYMQRHLAKVAVDVQKKIPDPNFSGIAVLDFEVFRAIWDRTPNIPSEKDELAKDKDFKDDWRDYIRRSHPEFDSMNEQEQESYLRETYENGVKKLFLQTLDVCRTLRPKAKWGFYGYPIRFYKNRREAPTNVVSYADGSYNGSKLNDRLQWMWDAVDIVCPSVYAPCVVVEPGEEVCQDQYSASDEMEFIQSMIGEAKRVANGKPVLPFIAIQYNTRHDCLLGEDVRDETLYDEIMGPAFAGADGAILWGDINNKSEMQHWQWLLDHKIMELMKKNVDTQQDDDNSDNQQAQDNNNPSSSRTTQLTDRSQLLSVYSIHRARATKKQRGHMFDFRQTHAVTIPFKPNTFRISKPPARKKK